MSPFHFHTVNTSNVLLKSCYFTLRENLSDRIVQLHDLLIKDLLNNYFADIFTFGFFKRSESSPYSCLVLYFRTSKASFFVAAFLYRCFCNAYKICI